MTQPNRREILKLLGAGLLLTSASTREGPSLYADVQEVSIAAWMGAWMRARNVVSRPLHIGRFAEPIYFLLGPIDWSPSLRQGDKYQGVEVPAGFVTDFASIPRLFWSLLRPDGEYAYAAVIHDYLYWTQTRSREEADGILLLAMKDFDVAETTATAIYEAIRIGGGKAWRTNSQLRLNGEKRVLKRFPQDPTIRWSIWKRQRNVFADNP